MTLPCKSPCRSRSASHSLSWTSVLRPGTAFMWCGFTSRLVRPSSSSKLYTGRQYTPVDSMAMCVTPQPPSQSASASRSAVIVPQVLTRRRTVPSGSVSSTHATTLRLWTSIPQHRGWTTCLVPSSSRRGRRGGGYGQRSPTCSSPRGWRHSALLDAPRPASSPRADAPAHSGLRASATAASLPHFHPRRCPVGAASILRKAAASCAQETL